MTAEKSRVMKMCMAKNCISLIDLAARRAADAKRPHEKRKRHSFCDNCQDHPYGELCQPAKC